MPARLNVLFVCGRNNRRGPTAERIFKTDRRIAARAVGIADTSKRKITASDIAWANLILVMERKYTSRIRDTFGKLGPLPPMESLDITDEFIFMQAELIDMLRPALDAALEKYRLDMESAAPAD